MKQELWILNSSLILIFLLALFAGQFLRQEPPVIKLASVSWAEIQKKKEEPKPQPKSWDKIFQNDLFDTFITTEIKAVKQSFTTPIPEPKQAQVTPPSEPKKVEALPPLNITIKGIIISSDERKSVAMIADETGKEGLYHLGEKIKDGQLIKIARNRIVVLRISGQQEVFYINKNDTPVEPAEKWKSIVKKINDQTFKIDPLVFKEEITSLGNFIDRVGIVGTAYQDGKPLGIKVGAVEKNEAATALGLSSNDIIKSVNNISLVNPKDRVKAYETVSQINMGGAISAVINRTGQDITLNYKLARVEKAKKTPLAAEKKPEGQTTEGKEGGLKMSRLQEREQTIRDFEKQQQSKERNQQAIMEIRKRLLENLQARIRNARTRQ